MPKKPDTCKPPNSTRQEYLRCLLVNHVNTAAYTAELEAVLATCKEK